VCSLSIYWFLWPWVILKGGTREISFFRANLRNYTRRPTVWPRTTKFCKVTHVGKRRVFTGPAMPQSQRDGVPASEFLRPLPTPRRLDYRLTKFGVITCRERYVSIWSGAIVSGAPAPQIFGASDMLPHDMTHSSQILHGDQIRWHANFYWLNHAPALSKNFVTQMLTRDLFAVANFVLFIVN